MKPVLINGKCRLIGHCRTCRGDAEFRERQGMPDICPHGMTTDNVSNGLGSLIEKLAKPVAKAFGMNCLDDQDKLKEGSPCAQKRDNLNLKK